jgi:hypothetical protein
MFFSSWGESGLVELLGRLFESVGLRVVTREIAAALAGRRPARRTRLGRPAGAQALEARVLLSNTPAGVPFQVNTSDSFGIGPVAMADDGRFTAIFSTYSDTWESDEVMWQRFEADGDRSGSEQQVNTYPFGYPGMTEIAMNGGGASVVAWQVSGSDGVYFRRFDAEGSPLGVDTRVKDRPNMGSRYEPSVAMAADGSFVVTWSEGWPPGNQAIYGQRYDANGVAAGDNFYVGTGSQSQVAMADDGSFVVTWTGLDGNGQGIKAQRYNAAGVAQGIEFRINTFVTGNQKEQSIAMNADGSFVVSWTSVGQDGLGDEGGIYAQRFNSSGVAVGGEFRVTTTTANWQYQSDVATGGDAGFIVTWTSRTTDGTTLNVFAQWYDSNGVAIGGEAGLNAAAETQQWFPSVAMAPNGSAVITWSDFVLNGEGQFLAQRFHRDNVAPTDIAVSADSVLEEQPAGTVVGTLSATDADAGETYTYSLVSGSGSDGNSSFTIVGNELRTAAVLDHETHPAYTIRVRVTDSLGGTFEKMLTIGVTNVIDPTLQLDGQVVAENQPKGTVVGTFDVSDTSNTSFTYTLVSGAGSSGNKRFRIVGNQLQTNAALNFEAQDSYSIRLRVTGPNGFSQIRNFTIRVGNNNEAITGLKFEAAPLQENASAGSAAGVLTAVDIDTLDTWTYTLVSGEGDADNSLFRITGNTVETVGSLDYEQKSTYSVRVRVTDVDNHTFEKVLTIRITNVNEAPNGLGLANVSLRAGAKARTTVGRAQGTDPDRNDRLTYSLAPNVLDNDQFIMSGNSLKTKFRVAADGPSSYTVRIRVTDAGGLSFEQDFVIPVTA